MGQLDEKNTLLKKFYKNEQFSSNFKTKCGSRSRMRGSMHIPNFRPLAPSEQKF